jgi:hypothetical protein
MSCDKWFKRRSVALPGEKNRRFNTFSYTSLASQWFRTMYPLAGLMMAQQRIKPGDWNWDRYAERAKIYRRPYWQRHLETFLR